MNPFRETIVASPWDVQRGDVPSIHGAVSEQCLKGIAHVRDSGRSAALLIHGEAGSGKTHLLRRLREQLTPQAPTDTKREECLFVWVRLQTSPRMIWRTLRRNLVEDWFRPVAGSRSQFHRILFHRLAQIRTAEGDLERWYEYMLDEVPDGLAELMDRIADSIHLDRNTAIAFSHIAFNRHVRDLRAWLAGDSLPQAALERMDLTQDEGTDEEREDQARQVVLMLCRLAGNALPIVLSFDQVEALQTTPDDTDALFAFGQLLSTLHDSTSNALLISCVQSSFATTLKDHARRADYDRMTSLGALSLDPLGRAQAEALIAARVTAIEEPEAKVWRLDPHELTQLLEKPLTPRRLLGVCAERFETRRPPEARSLKTQPTETVEQFLENRWTSLCDERLSANSPDRSEDILRHGLPMLAGLVAPEYKLVHDEQLPDVSVVLADDQGHYGLSVCTLSNMTSLAARLKRLKSQWASGRLKRLVLVRDTRSPLSPGAKKAREVLEELERHATVVFPPPEVLAALDALRALLSDAKSGDLAHGGQSVGPTTVAEWLTANLPEGLRTLVDQVLGRNASVPGDAVDAELLEGLGTLLSEQSMVLLEDAARQLQKPADALVSVAQRHPGQFRLLGQPPTAVFRTVEVRSPAVTQ